MFNEYTNSEEYRVCLIHHLLEILVIIHYSLLVLFCTKNNLAAARYVASLMSSKFLLPRKRVSNHKSKRIEKNTGEEIWPFSLDTLIKQGRATPDNKRRHTHKEHKKMKLTHFKKKLFQSVRMVFRQCAIHRAAKRI